MPAFNPKSYYRYNALPLSAANAVHSITSIRALQDAN